jgi:hypothetical protein
MDGNGTRPPLRRIAVAAATPVRDTRQPRPHTRGAVSHASEAGLLLAISRSVLNLSRVTSEPSPTGAERRAQAGNRPSRNARCLSHQLPGPPRCRGPWTRTGTIGCLWLAISRSVSVMACGAPRGRLAGVRTGPPLATSSVQMDGAIDQRAHDHLQPTLPVARSRGTSRPKQLTPPGARRSGDAGRRPGGD